VVIPVRAIERMKMAIAARTFGAIIRPVPRRDSAARAEREAGPIGKMIDTLVSARPRTAALALCILRRAYSDYPLALRLAALAAAMNDITLQP
jgi:hypothetical protein